MIFILRAAKKRGSSSLDYFWGLTLNFYWPLHGVSDLLVLYLMIWQVSSSSGTFILRPPTADDFDLCYDPELWDVFSRTAWCYSPVSPTLLFLEASRALHYIEKFWAPSMPSRGQAGFLPPLIFVLNASSNHTVQGWDKVSCHTGSAPNNWKLQVSSCQLDISWTEWIPFSLWCLDQ